MPTNPKGERFGSRAATISTGQTSTTLLVSAVAGLVGLTMGVKLSSEPKRRVDPQRELPPPTLAKPESLDATKLERPKPATARAARRLNRAAGLLATSVLADSAIEHYRGSFNNKAMFTPLMASALTLVASLHGTAHSRPAAHVARDTTYLLAAITGLIGTGFHIYNVRKRPGGFSWQNLFYAAPLGAPMALLLSGLVGFCSERVRGSAPGCAPRIFNLPAGRTMAVVAGAGLLGTTGEAGLMHFRGAFHNPLMTLPVMLPPIGALLLAAVATEPGGHKARWTRWWMRMLAMMGFGGIGLHAYGISRGMGGWRNWSQNILNGPPLPAPPSFAGLALAALAALRLMEDHPDA